MAINQDLIKFIKEARRRGFSDREIKAPLIKQGWSDDEVEKAFISLKIKSENRISLSISLPESVYNVIEKRAKKNLLSMEEQVEDIIRRSAVTGKLRNISPPDNIDDLLVSIFSRKKR